MINKNFYLIYIVYGVKKKKLLFINLIYVLELKYWFVFKF